MSTILVDTNIFIDHLRGTESATQFLMKNIDKIAISYVTYAELIQGCHNKSELKIVIQLLELFELIYADEVILKQSLIILKNQFLKDGIALNDAVIAATALERNISLVTHNRKHFSMIKDLKFDPGPSDTTMRSN